MEPLSSEVAELRSEVMDLRMAVHLLLQKFDSLENILRHDGPPLNVCASSFTTPSTMSATPESAGQRSSSTTDMLSIPSCGTSSSMETTPLRFESLVNTEFVSKIPVRQSASSQKKLEQHDERFDQKLPASKLPAITAKPSLVRVDTNEKYRKKLAQKLHQQQHQQGGPTPPSAGSKQLPAKLFAGTPPSAGASSLGSQQRQSQSGGSGYGQGAGLGSSGGSLKRYGPLSAATPPASAETEVALLHALEAAVISSPRLAGTAAPKGAASKPHDPLPSFPASRLLLNKAGGAQFAGTKLSSPSTGSVASAPSREREPRIATPYPAPSSSSVGGSPRAPRPAYPHPPRSHHLPAAQPQRAVRATTQDAPVSKRALLWHGGQLTHHPRAGSAGAGKAGEDVLHKTGIIRGGGKASSPVPADPVASPASPKQTHSQQAQGGAQEVLFGLQSPVMGARRRRSGGGKNAQQSENAISADKATAAAADIPEAASPLRNEASPAPPSTPLSGAPSPSAPPQPAFPSHVPTPSFLYTPADAEGERDADRQREREGAFTSASNGVLASAYSSLLDESTDSTSAAAGASWPQTDTFEDDTVGSPDPALAMTPGAGDSSGLFWEGMDTIIGSVPPPPTPATPFGPSAQENTFALGRSRTGPSGGKAVKFAAPKPEFEQHQEGEKDAFEGEDEGESEGVTLQVLMGGGEAADTHSAPHTPATASAGGGKKTYRGTPMPRRRTWPQEPLVELEEDEEEGAEERVDDAGDTSAAAGWGGEGDASTVGNTSAVELSFMREEDAPRFSDSDSSGGSGDEGRTAAGREEEGTESEAAATEGWAGQRRLAEEAAAAAAATASRGEGGGYTTAVGDITDLFDDYVPVPAAMDFDPGATLGALPREEGDAVAVAAAVLAANSSADPEESSSQADQGDKPALPRGAAPGGYYAQLVAMLQQQEELDRKQQQEEGEAAAAQQERQGHHVPEQGYRQDQEQERESPEDQLEGEGSE